ncbi:hypothetical protein V5O48_010985 [Marasmius crinis-equi]|uniref:MYND-type domain-containing protein n=1 Tax=Marasmius crinis-equi TaxID=585013 RepID=A0ABR3F6V1_9AGAR
MSTLARSTPLDPNFLRSALERFPTTHKAISALDRLGDPPTALDITPNEPVWTIIFAFLSLVHGMRPPRMSLSAFDATRAIWDSCIVPWMAALLRAIIPEFDGNGNHKVVEQGLVVIPKLVACNVRPEKPGVQGIYEAAQKMHRETPYLRPLFIRMWFKLVEQGHGERKSWTELLMYYGVLGDEDSALPYLDIEPALTEVDAGMILVRFMDNIRKEVRGLDDDRMLELSRVLVIADYQGTAPHRPLYNREIARHATPALVKLLAVFLFKFRELPPVRSLAFEWFYRSVNAILRHLLYVFQRGRVWIEEALNAGLIWAVFKADQKFLDYEQDPNCTRFASKSTNLTGRLFICINRLLIWPSILRQARRWCKRIEKGGYEAALSPAQKETHWWTCWRFLKHRMEAFHLMGILNEEECLCCNATCALGGSSPGDLQLREIKYLRCYDCQTAIYCSRKCQKEDWRSSHRTQCQIWARRRAEGRRPVSYADECHLRRLIHRYLDMSNHRANLNQSVKTYTPSQIHTRLLDPGWTAIPEEWRRKSRPIIVLIDFDTQSMSDREGYNIKFWRAECLQVMEPDQLVRAFPAKEREIMEMLEMWKGLPDGTCLGVGLFPDGTPGLDGVLVAEVLDQAMTLRLRA